MNLHSPLSFSNADFFTGSVLIYQKWIHFDSFSLFGIGKKMDGEHEK